MSESFGKLPLYFVENRGQVDERVSYYVQGSDKSVYFTSQGLTFVLTGKRENSEPQTALDLTGHQAILRPAAFRPNLEQRSAPQRWALKLDFVGANPGVRPRGQDQTEAVISYFKGTRDQWQAGLKTYSSIVYSDLWPGIDLVYAGTVNRMKYTFMVKPGADPNQIKLAYRGAASVKVNKAGQLEVNTPLGGFHDERPVSYQEMQGRRVEVATAYALEDLAGEETQVYGFQVGDYDRSQPLVLDPAVLVYAGYLGGGGDDYISGITVDSVGNAYVSGSTDSTNFPVTVGPDLTYNSNTDIFIAKVNAAGTSLIYAGYIGGSGFEFNIGIAVDSVGNAYITGTTESTEASFPVTVGPDLTYNGGANDAFVAKVNAAGTALVYCGYIGGSGYDGGWGIAVDSGGSAYISGITSSTEASFPVTVGPDLTFNGGFYGPQDAFVAKVNAMGTALSYCGYIGGSADDSGYAIAVDSAGNAYVGGGTSSTETSFPVTVGPDLTYNGGPADTFVAKINAAGTALVYCGYIGGGGHEGCYGITVSSAGNAYITGFTSSTEASFPVAVGPDLTYNGGSYDAFVAEVNTAGTALVYCSYIGGSDYEEGDGIAVDIAGNAYIFGTTSSTEASFPVAVGPDLTFNGGSYDAFVIKVNAGGTAFGYCGYIGGSGDDFGGPIAVDSASNAYVTGVTTSTEASFPVAVGPDLTFNGGSYDAFVAKIAGGDTPIGNNVIVQSGVVTTTFATVSIAGTTIVNPIDPNSAGTLPSGYTLAGGSAFDVLTTAIVTGPITICFYVPSVNNLADFSTLRVLHNEGGILVDRTVLLPNSPAPDFATRTICARVSSLSPFVIARLVNSPPVVGAITAPINPVQVNTSINANASFTDSSTSDTHMAVWNWGDSGTSSGVVTETNGSGSVSGSHTYTAAGVYTVTLTVTDSSNSSGQSVFQFIVIYDPGAGFVTGGGWINSPAGAYTPAPSLSGKASFGFVSKYEPGATTPTGNTEFQFRVANFNFKSSSYDWLVVAGARAQYKGSGTVNGSGNYGFLLTAIDGQINGGGGSDKFRIKIWDKNNSDTIVYDNQLGDADGADPVTVLGGGSIVIHKP